MKTETFFVGVKIGALPIEEDTNSMIVFLILTLTIFGIAEERQSNGSIVSNID